MAVIPNPPIPKPLNFTNTLPSVDLDVKKFDQLILTHGARIVLYKTLLCPNTKLGDNGLHEIGCTICNRGFIDRAPVETWAFFSNQNLNKQFSRDGVWDDQSAQVTFLSGVGANYFGRVELLDHSMDFFERLQRQNGTLDRLRYSAIKVDVLVDKNGIEYDEGTHFQLTSTGDIEWIHATDVPTIGTPYSVYYSCRKTFRVLQAMHQNRFTQASNKTATVNPVELNQSWVCKIDFLLTRLDINGVPLSSNQVIDVDPTIA